MGAIYKRELRSYFCSMTGYIFIAAAMIFTSIYFVYNNLLYGYPYFSAVLESSLLIYIIIVPILTMRSIADERHSKTDQLLLTSPASVTSIVMGKYLAMMTVFAIPLAIFCVCPIIIATGGSAYLFGDYMAIFCTLCIGALFVAIGMFISSLTENQIIAAVVSLVVLLIIYMWDSVISLLPTSAIGSLICSIVILALIVLAIGLFSRNRIITIAVGAIGLIGFIAVYCIEPTLFEGLVPRLLSAFSVLNVLANFTYYYVFDLGGLFMLLSVAAMFVFLTVQTIQKRRWS